MKKVFLGTYQRHGLAALLTALSCSAFAAEPAQSAESQQTTGSLERITVTAQRRVQSIQDTPATVDAFSADMIDQKGIEKPTDLVKSIPNVDFFSFFGEASNPSFCFRGICMNVQFSDSFEPPVAMYTNDVYVSSGFSQSLQMFDVDRIEVLKGPQGTLYGRNTTGGLVNVVTKKPTYYPEASFSVDYGTHNDIKTFGVVSGPISDSVRGRLAIQHHTKDAYVGGVIHNSDANGADEWALRGSLDIDINASTSLMLTSEIFRVRDDAQASTLNGTLSPETGDPCSYSQLQSGHCVGIYGQRDVSAESLYGGLKRDTWLGADIEGGFDPQNDVDNYSFNATLKTNLADNLDFESITGFISGHKDYIEDLDGSMQMSYDDRLKADAATWSQEFRLLGQTQGINWITGLFYYHDDRDVDTWMFPVTAYHDYSNKKTESVAAYVNADIPLFNDKWLLTLGGRYTYEGRTLDFNRVGSWVSDVTGEHRSTYNDNVDWRAVLSWKPVDKTMVYLSASSAFRSANMNNQSIWGTVQKGSDIDAIKPVSPEYMTAYELGIKSDFWHDRARFNASVFYYDYEDMQYAVYAFDDDLQVGSTVLQNLDKVTVYGAEAAFIVNLTNNLRFNVSYGNTHSEIKADVTDSDGDSLRGNELPMSNPTLSSGLTYDLGLADYGDLRLSADYSWKDDHYFSVSNSMTSRQESYGITDLQAVWTSTGGDYEVMLYGKNIFDKKYAVYAGEIADYTQNIVWGEGATWGIKFTYNFM